MVHALHLDTTPNQTLAVVETRALGADIVTGIEFHLQRCIETGVAIFAITDGSFTRSCKMSLRGNLPRCATRSAQKNLTWQR